jgi:hypothetical protein
VQADLVARFHEAGRGVTRQTLTQGREDLSQAVAGALVRRVAPEQRRQRVASLHLSGMQREIGEEGFDLFPGKADGPSRGEPRLERAEQGELQRRHDDRGL